jgi:ubiquinone/menaquinone biosynthesis C-methylase UbiE
MIDADAHLERIRAQFGRQADAYVRLRHTTDERSLNGLVLVSGAAADSRVLDVACGPGFLTMAFAARCRRAIGFDATEPFLAMARVEADHRGLHNVEFQLGNAEQLPFPDGAFDVASCRAAFHHFPRPERVLAEMARVTAPHGRIVVADFLSSDDPVKAVYHNHMERLCDPTHVRSMTAAEFAALFAGAGLVERLQTEVTYDYELEEWMAHGGPDDATAAQIRALMEASIDTDRCALNVRRQAGGIWFTHRAVAYVLEGGAPSPPGGEGG